MLKFCYRLLAYFWGYRHETMCTPLTSMSLSSYYFQWDCLELVSLPVTRSTNTGTTDDPARLRVGLLWFGVDLNVQQTLVCDVEFSKILNF